MASIIEGYTYDIFISYRQNDNKYDGWVTEFVDNLNKELEANIKDKISVYFDINPHNGLLETHSVDKSLEDKLKCLIFIPIISRTYCDPKSFAWQHEFCVFNKFAKEDEFGRDIRLASGNVTSRILPVKIHDLDPEDNSLLENELGVMLRSLEFIYKEPGVNRPLKSDDNEKSNLNKTKYRNQINKVANAIKEIITAIEQYKTESEEVQKEGLKPLSNPRKSSKTKILTWPIIAIALIILGLFLIPKLFKSEEHIEKSIAVLPFRNLSNDTTQLYFSDGIVETILNYLYKVGGLKVISSTSTKRYRDTELSIGEIAKELGVNSILEGSVQKIGNNVRITAQLIDARTDVHLWSEIYDKDISDIFAIQSEVAQRVAKELKTTLTSEEKEQINKFQTQNPEAYNLYMQGRYFLEKRDEGIKKSIEYFEKAVNIDPDYALAYAGLADAYFNLPWYTQFPKTEGFARSKEYVYQSLRIDENLAEAHAVLGAILTWDEWKWEEARKELKLAIELNPNLVTAHSYYSELLDILRENSEARKQINIALELDPFFPAMHYLSGRYYYNEGRNKESLVSLMKAKELNFIGHCDWYLFNIYLKLGEDLKAIETLKEILLSDTLTAKDTAAVKDIYNKSGINGVSIWYLELTLKKSESVPNLGDLETGYARVGNKEETLKWLEKDFEKLSPRLGFPRINNLVDFDFLRLEPRFQDIIEKMGLSLYQAPK